QALALAGEARADVAVVAGVAISPPVFVRGLPTEAVAVTATVRAIDRRGPKVLGQGTAVAGAALSSGASSVNDPVVSKAIDRALIAATSDALPRPPKATTIGDAGMFTGNDTPVS